MFINPLLSPVPSLTSICYSLFRYLATHPLIINPIVYHPLTGEPIKIERYKLFNGIDTSQGLSCSIFPHYQDKPDPPNPTALNVSVLYEPSDLGSEGWDRAIYHICINLQYNNLILGNKVEGSTFTQVPSEAPISPEQILLTSRASKDIDLYINPGADIIGNYLEILRLVIEDPQHKEAYLSTMRISSIELSFVNLKSKPWESGKEVYFHQGEALIRVDSFVSRGWRNRFNTNISDIRLNSNDQ